MTSGTRGQSIRESLQRLRDGLQQTIQVFKVYSEVNPEDGKSFGQHSCGKSPGGGCGAKKKHSQVRFDKKKQYRDRSVSEEELGGIDYDQQSSRTPSGESHDGDGSLGRNDDPQNLHFRYIQQPPAENTSLVEQELYSTSTYGKCFPRKKLEEKNQVSKLPMCQLEEIELPDAILIQCKLPDDKQAARQKRARQRGEDEPRELYEAEQPPKKKKSRYREEASPENLNNWRGEDESKGVYGVEQFSEMRKSRYRDETSSENLNAGRGEDESRGLYGAEGPSKKKVGRYKYEASSGNLNNRRGEDESRGFYEAEQLSRNKKGRRRKEASLENVDNERGEDESRSLCGARRPSKKKMSKYTNEASSENLNNERGEDKPRGLYEAEQPSNNRKKRHMEEASSENLTNQKSSQYKKTQTDEVRRCVDNDMATYFNDGVRQVDFVLVYSETDNNPESAGKLEYYLSNLEKAGLHLETVHSRVHKDKTFIKLHIPREVLLHVAKTNKISLAFQSIYHLYEHPALWSWMDTILTTPDPEHKVYGRNPESVSGDQPQEPTSAERIMAIHEILEAEKFGNEVDEYGVREMLKQHVLMAAYPLHENGWRWTRNGLLSDRQLLKAYWANIVWGICKKQPVQLVKKYFGPAIGFYFALVGYYIQMLLVPAWLGVITILYGLITVNNQRNSRVYV